VARSYLLVILSYLLGKFSCFLHFVKVITLFLESQTSTAERVGKVNATVPFDLPGMKNINFYWESGVLTDNPQTYRLRYFQATVCTLGSLLQLHMPLPTPAHLPYFTILGKSLNLWFGFNIYLVDFMSIQY
jgi:hypothetical protein